MATQNSDPARCAVCNAELDPISPDYQAADGSWLCSSACFEASNGGSQIVIEIQQP